MCILQVTNLAKGFMHPGKNELEELVLAGVTFSLKENDFLTFVGVSGCGKTTLLKCLVGLQNPSWGEIEWDASVKNNSMPPAILVFQDYSKSLLSWRTALGNVYFPLESKGIKKTVAIEMAKNALAKVGLGDYQNFYPRQLSGGMQQRVQIARAIVCNPKVLLLDEPFSSLDAISKSELHEELLNWHANLGLTVIMVTHDIEEAVYLSNRVILLSKPARVVHDQIINVPKTLNYLETKMHPEFISLSMQLYSKLRIGHLSDKR